ncbi:NAD(P)-dependent dehydrogenase, short-chain alcohol dehydrogenase family [Amycolatopsis arida]|uniref:NAD(P)-dependent dehydrogenase, short-chain alcohol dehydrogenase family n=1 Tax=Amycolatopsis arida TaxID=587909 RepID=A0A1I5Y0V8_9PSEU|nr:oxidoreductase [Amycolatopsis arida]TDX97164.1 NAD(P)-dependent dehydrogenase (short-subunit alcohol dehydrogenase family) [Amycolatopsis arida]SFQ37774.1 NAD(P)-dependent dehydrogenase, short-chain alcohol dehydrogenase family [Amycolatopsis arida]
MVSQARKWTENDIPDQAGRVALVTGANSGLGLRTAEVLTTRGAKVLLACRSAERGAGALDRVARLAGAGNQPELVPLDLADLASVRDAARQVRDRTGDGLHLLVNNAGVMGTPLRRTKDGFELQFGTNHLGHAALTWLLMPALRDAARSDDRPRVVTVSSMAATTGQIDLDDPNFERRGYNPAAAYGQAKLANQVFAVELDRRLRAAGEQILSVAAHPGYTVTGLGSAMARSYDNPLIRTVVGGGVRIGELLLGQSVRMGTLPQLHAATAPEIAGGDYVGPDGLRGVRGHPVVGRPLGRALKPETGAGLWELTAKLTGVTPDPA